MFYKASVTTSVTRVTLTREELRVIGVSDRGELAHWILNPAGGLRRSTENYGRTKKPRRILFTAIDRDSKLLLCWHAGQRSQKDTRLFADKLYAATSGRPTISTDGFSSYTFIIPCVFDNLHAFSVSPRGFEVKWRLRLPQRLYQS